MKARSALAAISLAFVIASPARASPDDPARVVATGAATELEHRYVYPARAKEAGDLLRGRAESGVYDGKSKDALAFLITADLAGVLHDKHVRVSYSDDVLPPASPHSDKPSPEEQARVTAFERGLGFGMARTAHLPGNVGYVDLRIFAGTKPERDRVIDALADSLAYSDAVILDLRQNHGGDPDAVARLLSHFLPAKTHLNDFVARGDTDAKIDSSTYTSAVGGPVITAPLYVLTSGSTFSGGEECAYDVQSLKRGTLVGGTTGGGANPGSTHRLGDHFDIFVPDARARNPITKTNWEGTGVVPDVAVAPDRALVTAYGMALDAELHDTKLDPDDRSDLKRLRDGLDTSDDAAILTEPSDHANSATAAATENRAITALASDLLRRTAAGHIDRSQLSARFSASLTQAQVDTGKAALAPYGTPSLVYRGAGITATSKTYLYDAVYPTIRLNVILVIDAGGKVDAFSFDL